MSQVLCVPIYCRCGARAVWAADLEWLAREGLDIAGSTPLPLASKALTLPRDAVDVTGQFNVRCARCFEHLPVISLMRSRLAAGVGLILEAPSEKEVPAPPPRPAAPRAAARGTRITGRDGRRAPRTRGAADLRARATVTFDLTVVDISIFGLLADHNHEVQAGALYTLALGVPSSPEPLRLTARAVWTASHRVAQARGARQTIYRSGFEFVNLELRVATALEAYVNECLRREGARRP